MDRGRCAAVWAGVWPAAGGGAAWVPVVGFAGCEGGAFCVCAFILEAEKQRTMDRAASWAMGFRRGSFARDWGSIIGAIV
jgi:hypothetical protein